MKTTKYRIALASACGATIGYCLGTTFLSGAWLILAALFGGACGWIAFDSRGFVKAVSQSVREAAHEVGMKLQELWAEPWGKILPRAIRFAIDPLLILQMIGTIMAFAVTPLIKPGGHLVVFAAVYGLILSLGVLISVMFFCEELKNKAARMKVLDPERVCLFTGKMSAPKFLALTNPVILPFTAAWFAILALYHCGRGLVWLIRRAPLAIRFGWLVTVRTCLLAHNNGRLASFAGASLGAIIGVIAGYLVVALFAGAAIGTLAHYVGALFPKAYVTILAANLKTAKAEIS